MGTIYIFIIPVCSLSRCPGPTITRYNRQVLSRLARCIHLEIKGMVGSGPHPCYRMTHGSMTDYIDVLFIPPIGESAVHICCHPFFLFLLPCPLGPGVEARGWWFSSPNSFVPPLVERRSLRSQVSISSLRPIVLMLHFSSQAVGLPSDPRFHCPSPWSQPHWEALRCCILPIGPRYFCPHLSPDVSPILVPTFRIK